MEIKELCNAGADTQTNSEEYYEPSPSDQVTSTESEKSNDQMVLTENIKDQVIQDRDRAVVCEDKEYKYERSPSDQVSSPKIDDQMTMTDNIKKQATQDKDTALHQGVRLYSCVHCPYQSGESGNFKRHVQSKHEGIKNFECNKCEYKATYKKNLTYHIQAKHEGIRYSCDQCDQQYMAHHSLMRHIKQAHTTGENNTIMK